MYKKRCVCFILLITVLISSFSSVVYGKAKIDTSRLDKGVVSVSYSPDSKVKTKVIIRKGDKKYTYDLNLKANYPLTLGNGDYEIMVLENLSEGKYTVVEEDSVKLDIKDSNIVFLQSVQQINWNTDTEAVKKAASLTKNYKSDYEKAVIIYNYIIKNFKYDKSKVHTIKENYIPDIDSVFRDKKGVCYDFAVLYAAMLRSVGIPAKLVMGYKNDIKEYHTWNQVYLKESNKWITIDTTYDISVLGSNKKPAMIKNNTQYNADKIY